jgi:hypothetical protein
MHSWRHPDGKLCVFEAASQDDAQRLEALLALLNQAWVELGQDVAKVIERDRALITEIFALSRPVGRLTWDVDQICQHPEALQSLLIGSNSEFWKAHQFTSLRKPAPEYKKGDTLTVEHLPFPSSGNPRTDQIGALLAAGWKPSEVQSLCQWLSAEEVDKVLHVNNELLRSEERLSEAIKRGYEEWKVEQAQQALEAAIAAQEAQGAEVDRSKIKAKDWFEDDWIMDGL